MQTRVVGLDVLAGAPGTNPSTFLVENSASAQLTPSLPPASLSHLTAAEYTHLSSEINFIQNHDEHADIASGFQDTQEGLADETLESPDNFASAAQREAQSSEPIVNSALQQYLVATLERLGKQIKKHGQPDCYRRGDFIIRPKHAIFILHDAARTGLASDYLCHRDIFVWLPALLPGAPEAFKCTCGKRLSKNAETLQGVVKGLQKNGHPPCSIVYTDSPQTEHQFHEKITPSLLKNVQHILPSQSSIPFKPSKDIKVFFVEDAAFMDQLCADILQQVDLSPSSHSSHLLVAFDVQVIPLASSVQAIQLCTPQINIVFKTSHIHSQKHFPAALRAILTSQSIIKLGCQVKQGLLEIAKCYNDNEIQVSLESNPAILEIGLHSKLKGAVTHAASPLNVLSESILKKSLSLPPVASISNWNLPDYIQNLHNQVDCIWQLYKALYTCNSVGLHLALEQSQKNGHPVTLFHGDKPVAGGCIIWPHPGFINAINDNEGQTRQIRVTSTRSLISITQVLVPGSIHALHSQSIQWIFDHEKLAVVTTSTLRSRSQNQAIQLSNAFDHAFALPAPRSYQLDKHIPTLTLSIVENDQSSIHENSSAIEGIDEDDSEHDNSFYEELDDMFEHLGEELHQIPESTQVVGDNSISDNSMPTRVLDDAFHFMDRLLRLLSKKNSAFKSFSHDFSEAIFIRDINDEARVKQVLETNGLDWEFMIRAKAHVINRRVRRYIPAPKILAPRLEALFNGYKDIICSTQQGRKKPFFSKEAREMADRLLETARQGFLSDPDGISLYYIMATDKDGLTIYRTVRGTNSVEGGVHMAVRRVFGSLQASPELAECLLLNWILRRNRTVGHLNRTGKKYQGHFAPWLSDEITELTVELGVLPSFQRPHVLVTRIATAETFGIQPLASDLAEKYHLTVLPPRQETGIPHHRDMPVHTLTRLSTKPINRYRYLQIRQRTLYPVTPVHTYAEFQLFQKYIHDAQFKKGSKTHLPHEFYKGIDWEKVAAYWNTIVHQQENAETDSNKRIYGKLPSHLERHAKRIVSYRSERSTILMGSNAAALKLLNDLLTASNDNNSRVMAQDALTPPEVPAGEEDLGYRHFTGD
ncbi:hypothetical protein D9757_007324 [Collybiopsis confluens]|uniref:Uncharacterized protein n=1 Tax=Collybiopsis confluens TaxID=2823264 RepID=A0A8H5HH35_9AGAR|nr:hypothetical protein D9757_007324 [Collybiopsis confluens]